MKTKPTMIDLQSFFSRMRSMRERERRRDSVQALMEDNAKHDRQPPSAGTTTTKTPRDRTSLALES